MTHRPGSSAAPLDGAEVALDEDLKVPYVAALWHFARVSGLHESEEHTIDALARSLAVDPTSVEVARHAGLDAARLRSLLARVDGAYLVRDALRIAHADGVVDAAERQIIARLAEATGLSPERLAQIHRWVEHEQALRGEWLAIVEPTEGAAVPAPRPIGQHRPGQPVRRTD
jgi:uncharacterized tellurite resistance protein B-like protein